MAAYVDKPFEDVTINIDDNSFTRCTFKNCTIVYSGGVIPVLVQNSFYNCKWVFDGAAQRVIDFLTGMYAGGATPLVEEIIRNIKENRPGEEAPDEIKNRASQ